MKGVELFQQLVIRFLVVTGFIIALAFLIYGQNVFTPTMWPFQYFVSGITIGIALTTFREKYFRQGLLLLLLWYVVITEIISKGNYWVYILDGVYIVLIALAVYLYLIFAGKPYIKNETSRVIVSIIVVGLFNCLIILVLNLFSGASLFTRFSETMDVLFLNLKIGLMIGLFMGIGIELADYLIVAMYKTKKVVE